MSACRVTSPPVSPLSFCGAAVPAVSESSVCMLSEPVSNGMCREVCVLVMFMKPSRRERGASSKAAASAGSAAVYAMR